ncbi:CocE/NonD family hydrolase C-terminal non-catalytic domain-containing protein [Streptosporangium sp. NPDC002721]|uniref:CocE/NonD family hydrolase C-terminal non-catalytic domain-containing protein n=1 Tax=Streptosporangium sp. NPDC002721 TaxID=3366188 RepID=UPI0036900721
MRWPLRRLRHRPGRRRRNAELAARPAMVRRRAGHLGRDGIVRLREAGDIRTVEVALWPMAHRFKRGHRIRLQVSSGAHPRFGRNPGTGQPLATGRDLRVSDHEIFHDRQHPSALWLPLIPGAS